VKEESRESRGVGGVGGIGVGGVEEYKKILYFYFQ
jgi:hypothetical protein